MTSQAHARHRTETKESKRRYEPEELLRLFNGPETQDRRYTKRTMMQLYALALYCGARLNELCERRLGDVEQIDGGYLLHIRRGKTNGAVFAHCRFCTRSR